MVGAEHILVALGAKLSDGPGGKTVDGLDVLICATKY